MSVRPARPAPRSRLALCLRAAPPPTERLVQKRPDESWRDVLERTFRKERDEAPQELERRLDRLTAGDRGEVQDPVTLEDLDDGEYVLLENGKAFTKTSLAKWLRRSLRDESGARIDRHERREVPTNDGYRVSDAEAEEAGVSRDELERLERADAGRTPDYSGEVSEGEDILTADEPRARGAGGQDYVTGAELAVMRERGETAVLGASPSLEALRRFRDLRLRDERRAVANPLSLPLPSTAYTRPAIAAGLLIQSGRLLGSLSPFFKRDETMVTLAVASWPSAAQYAAVELMESRDFVRRLVIAARPALNHVTEALFEDPELETIADYPDGVFVEGMLADGRVMGQEELEQFRKEGEFARVERNPSREAVVAWRSRFQADMRLYNEIVAQRRNIDLEELRTRHGRPWMVGRLLFAVAAVLSNGRQLAYVSPFLQDNALVVELAVNQAPEALQYASDRLRDDVAFVRRLVIARPEAFEHAGELPRADAGLRSIAGVAAEPPPPRPAPQRQRSQVDDAPAQRQRTAARA